MKLHKFSSTTQVRRYQPGLPAWLAKPGLVLLVALTMLATTTLAGPGQARAANNDPYIKFLSPIYPGQNGNAAGPVGTLVDIQGGGNWTGGNFVTVMLADEANDTPGQPGSACTNGSDQVRAPTTGPYLGEFTETFYWPATVNKVGHSYWACGNAGSTPSLGISLFTVLSASPPSLHVDVPTVAQGGSVQVTGQNWLPGNQQITIFAGPCVSCGNVNQKQVTANADGTFSTSVPIPGNIGVGTTVFVYATGQPIGPLDKPALTADEDGSLSLTVVDQPTPTATSTIPLTVTSTTLPTKTAAGTATAIPGASASDGSGNSLLIVLLSVLGAVLALAAIVLLFLFFRSRQARMGTPGDSSGPPRYTGTRDGYARQTGVSRTGGTPFDAPAHNLDFPDAPPSHSGGRSGPRRTQPDSWDDPYWKGAHTGPDGDDFNDQPTVGNVPWR